MKTIFQKIFLPAVRLPYDVALSILIIRAMSGVPATKRRHSSPARLLSVLLLSLFSHATSVIAQKAPRLQALASPWKTSTARWIFLHKFLILKKLRMKP